MTHWNHYFEKRTLLGFPRVVSECSGDDISDKVLLHQVCTGAAVAHVWEEHEQMNKTWGSLVWGPYALAFPGQPWYLLKIIKYIQKSWYMDSQIHSNCEFLWRKLLVQNCCHEFIRALCRAVLPGVKFLFSSISQIERKIIRALDVLCNWGVNYFVLSHLFCLKHGLY